MCDFSLQAFKSRPAVVGETLITHNFGTGTVGLIAPDKAERGVAVCVMPGTELEFIDKVRIGIVASNLYSNMRTARFRQIDKDNKHTHHDALEFPDGSIVMLTWLLAGQRVRVLQLPAKPRSASERKAQRRVEFAG